MMADTALDVQTDSGKAERACAWCGAVFIAKVHNAKFCGTSCKERMRFDRHRLARIESAREYRKANRDDIAARSRARYQKFKADRPDEWRSFVDRMSAAVMEDRAENPEKHAEISRLWRRRRAAAAAISLLIMPIENAELNQ